MTLSSSIGLLAALLIVAAIPGPGVLMVVSRTIAQGLKSGLALSAGIVMGDYFFIILVVSGLSFIAQVLGPLFIIIKYLGAAYLIYLGLSAILSPTKMEDELQKGNFSSSFGANFLTGLLTTISNPKAILFYMGFFPAFVDVVSLTMSDVILICILATLGIGSVMITYAYMAQQASTFVKKRGAGKIARYFSGGILVGTGVLLASADR